jgi:hypothetical protein
MKKYIILFILLFGAGIAISDIDTFEGTATDSLSDIEGSTVASGGGCTLPTTDVMAEGWGNPLDETWGGTGGTTNQTPTGSPPSTIHVCDAAIDFNVSAANEERVFDYGETIARGSNNVNVDFAIRVNSTALEADYDSGPIIQWDTDTDRWDDDGVAMLNIRRLPGPIYYLECNGSANTYTLTLETWIHGRVHMDTTAASSYLVIDVDQDGDFSDEGTTYAFTRNDTADGQYLVVGPQDAFSTAGESCNMEIGYVSVNTP